MTTQLKAVVFAVALLAAGYDVLQQSSRPSHLTRVEAWRDHKALEAHETAQLSVKFRDLSTPVSGALFDQRLYRAMR